MDSADLIEQRSKDSSSGHCKDGLQHQVAQSPYTVGASFLQSVVAVFHVGVGEMRFAKHRY
ncbi:hypothetical protein BT63DRAFT_428722 [Microthyrium microscopicum]|uniref:Uncharacterized protein n=1 Tax=Microthyrium microscopicum TaxID=703497 RepID=A0A6A6U3R1_9PEZI|nr:hypothetical protein BT63DRAFT_428722 [Microthyrium microscopicum]